jgi:hypothetical protein
VRAKHHNVYTGSYVEVYRGEIGAKKHFCPIIALRIPHNPPPPPHQQRGDLGRVAVFQLFFKITSCAKDTQGRPPKKGV